MDKQIRAAWEQIQRLAAQYGTDALLNEESRRPTMRGFKIAHARKSAEIDKVFQHLMRLHARRAKAPIRVPVKDVTPAAVVKLATQRKHLMNLLKMVAYQVETDLFQNIRASYQRAEQEGRTLVQSMLASAADLEVTQTQLRIVVAPLSSAHKTRVLRALCEDLNKMNAVFPGTRLRLRYAVRELESAQKRTI